MKLLYLYEIKLVKLQIKQNITFLNSNNLNHLIPESHSDPTKESNKLLFPLEKSHTWTSNRTMFQTCFLENCTVI